MCLCPHRLLRLIALALDLPADFFDVKFDRPVANVRAVRAVHHFTVLDMVDLLVERAIAVHAGALF